MHALLLFHVHAFFHLLRTVFELFPSLLDSAVSAWSLRTTDICETFQHGMIAAQAWSKPRSPEDYPSASSFHRLYGRSRKSDPIVPLPSYCLNQPWSTIMLNPRIATFRNIAL